MKNLRPKTLGCKDIGNRKSEFVAKAQQLCSDEKMLTSFPTVGPRKLWNRKTTIWYVQCLFNVVIKHIVLPGAWNQLSKWKFTIVVGFMFIELFKS